MNAKTNNSKITWFTDLGNVEPDAVRQVEQTASLPFVEGLAVMPDVHYGKGSTVGTVVVTRGAVMPACVGVDIGCGMIAVRTSLRPEQVIPHAEEIARGIERRVPTGIGPRGMNDYVRDDASAAINELEEMALASFGDANHMAQHAPKWREQVGSLGGGNHFIEVCIGHPIEEGFVSPHDDAQGEVWVILHSGSRAVGNKTGTFWTKAAKWQSHERGDVLPNEDLAFLSQGTEPYDNYMLELGWCQRYAQLNRDVMMDRVLRELTMTTQGLTGVDCVDALPSIEIERINCHHNYVEKRVDGSLVTRKGAIFAGVSARGLIPGSMGARSYVVTGLGNAASFESAPHGAGRRMSRTRARREFSLDAVRAQTEGVTIRLRESIVDEAPGAYKDIEAVMRDARELVRPTHVLRQFVCVKGD